MTELNLTGSGSVLKPSAGSAAVTWHYDETEITQIGHAPEAREHRGEHHVAEYKGHKLRMLRELKPLWPDEPHSQLVQSWQGEVDGALVGQSRSHSNEVAADLIAHVDSLKP